METIVIQNINEINQAAEKFLALIKTQYQHSSCITFYGEMGAGKTTFIKAFCQTLGVTDNVASPTFAIVNEYLTAQKTKIFHFDLYRIKDLEEAMAAGAEDYLYSDGLCLIEWPEIIEPLLPKQNTIKVTITIDSKTQQRILNIEMFNN